MLRVIDIDIQDDEETIGGWSTRSVRGRKNSRPKTLIYFWLVGETTMENVIGRHSRPYKEYRRLLPWVFTKSNLPGDTKVRWSQKAGCPCGCSPGFIVLDKTIYSCSRDIHVKYEVVK